MSQEFRRLSSAVMQPVLEAEKNESISFWKAWLLPRVILYSSALFLTKMAVYNLLLQLPTFLKTDDHFKPHYTEQQTANLSTVIDLGAMLGSICLGKLSDLIYGKRSPIALGALIVSSAVSFTLYSQVYNMTTATLFIMFFLIGFFLSGLNNMIQGACSADLGKQEALKGNEKAISTVTGIIDGTGTMGSAVGQLIVSETLKYGWQDGYLLVIAINISLTLIPILRIVYDEFKELYMIKVGKQAMGLSKPAATPSSPKDQIQRLSEATAQR